MPATAVDAYWTDLDARAAAPSLVALLDNSERSRADRFRFERDRSRFIVRRGLLRMLLSRHLGCRPTALQFTQNRFGKPALQGSDLRFNVSHSWGMALYVVGQQAELGCDIERLDDRIDIHDIAAGLFAPGETRMLERLPPEQRAQAFFRCWTRKEAYVKALGTGLSHRLDNFDASGFDASGPDAIGGWTVRSFEPRPQFHAAVATRGESMALVLRPF